jgi:hypothetical protein
MATTIAARKQKARRLQQKVRDMILATFPELTPDDVRSTPMGVNGEDVQLSPAARKLLPLEIECKARKRIGTVYQFWDETTRKFNQHTPILVIQQDRATPLVVLDAETFIRMFKR